MQIKKFLSNIRKDNSEKHIKGTNPKIPEDDSAYINPLEAV